MNGKFKTSLVTMLEIGGTGRELIRYVNCGRRRDLMISDDLVVLPYTVRNRLFKVDTLVCAVSIFRKFTISMMPKAE